MRGNFGHAIPASVSDLFGDAFLADNLTLVQSGTVDKALAVREMKAVLSRGEARGKW